MVFLCGAGVSYPAGMPDFPGLARYVVEALGVPKDASLRAKLARWDDKEVPVDERQPLDQIFNLLQQQYGASEIEALIAERLKTKSETDVSAHETILRLSRSVDDKPQIVTTNFDLLFEEATGRQLTTYAHPSLPNLAAKQSINGLIYLHGRISPESQQGEAQQKLVVSSSDFGQAYLVDGGWATRFMQDLLDRYTVVLLGYSANDPPVSYLLQGLGAQGYGNRDSLFTFDIGTEEEVSQRWKDRGVQAIAYPETDAHSALWDTLSAWADRADDPLLWRQRIVDLSRRGPRNLAPHERGQAASLVRTDIGARLFADADPPPPGEWLCVFDHHVRYGPVGRSFGGSQPDFDPLAEYGLDDDPPRPSSDWNETGRLGEDLLSLRSVERPTNTSTRLAGTDRQFIAPLSPRLAHLADWIVKIAHEPVAPWWTAKYPALHPDLLDQIERRVQRADEPFHLARPIWRLLIEKLRAAFDDGIDLSWYRTLDRIKTEGWTNGVLRAFERRAAPYLKVELLPDIDGSKPPVAEWSQIHQCRVVDFGVAFPLLDELPEIPDDVLPAVYQILRRHLEMAVGMLKDIGTEPISWRTSTFYPEQGATEHPAERSQFLFLLRDLFNRMAEIQPGLLRADIALWSKEDLFFFNKLHLWAWTFDTLFSGDEVADGLLAFSDKAFWKEYDRRELLHLLRRRWRDLPADRRERLERRLVEGRARYDREAEDGYNQRRSIRSATILGWLMKQDCELSDNTRKALPDLRSADPRWCPEWDEAADRSYDTKGGTFRTDPDPSPLSNAPLSQIIPLAKKHTQSSFDSLTAHRPFDGLVEQHTRRAIAALTNTARHGCYPVEFWRAAMQNWPDGTRQRLVWLFGARLARLPSEIVFKLRHEMFFWLEKRLPVLAAQDQPRALSILDVLLDKLFEGEEEAVEEGNDDTQIRAIPPEPPRKSFEHALRSLVGEAVELLVNLLNSQNLGKGAGLPPEIKLRLERLVAAPGEGFDHAAYTIAQQLKWLDYIDPEWTRRMIVPWFNLEHSVTEPAWNGFLHNTSLPEPELFSLLKPSFLKVFNHASKFNWDDHVSRRLHEFLVIGCFWHQDDPAYISFDEVRRALQQTDDKGRAHVISRLAEDVVNSQEWTSFGKPFLEKAWPREVRFQTEQTSRMFVAWAGKTGDLFPEVVRGILPYLVPILDSDMFAYDLVRQHGGEGSELPKRFPDDTLTLLDKSLPDSLERIPYNLDAVVEMVAEAKPSLRQDRRWWRLRDLALRR